MLGGGLVVRGGICSIRLQIQIRHQMRTALLDNGRYDKYDAQDGLTAWGSRNVRKGVHQLGGEFYSLGDQEMSGKG